MGFLLALSIIIHLRSFLSRCTDWLLLFFNVQVFLPSLLLLRSFCPLLSAEHNFLGTILQQPQFCGVCMYFHPCGLFSQALLLLPVHVISGCSVGKQTKEKLFLPQPTGEKFFTVCIFPSLFCQISECQPSFGALSDMQ